MFRQVAEACRAKGIEVLDCMGKNVFYVGESGAGCTAKLGTQYLGYTNLIAAAEGMLIGAKAGLDLTVLAQIVPLSAGSSRAFEGFPGAVFSGTFPTTGTLDFIAQDIHLACELARDVQAPARIGDIADDVLQRAQAPGIGALRASGGGADIGANGRSGAAGLMAGVVCCGFQS